MRRRCRRAVGWTSIVLLGSLLQGACIDGRLAQQVLVDNIGFTAALATRTVLTTFFNNLFGAVVQ